MPVNPFIVRNQLNNISKQINKFSNTPFGKKLDRFLNGPKEYKLTLPNGSIQTVKARHDDLGIAGMVGFGGAARIAQLTDRINKLVNEGGKGSKLYYQLTKELNELKAAEPLTKSMLTGANQLARKNALESELSAIEADLPKLQKEYNEIYNSVLRDYKGAKPEFNLDSYASEGSGLGAALDRKYEILEELGINSNKKGTIDYFIEDLPFKNGGKIHIKKKNRGKFTDYCGGKVTEECIRRGKNSSNPTIRKRATFAANARKWNKK